MNSGLYFRAYPGLRRRRILMKFNWKSKRLPMAAPVLFLGGAQVAMAQTKEAPKVKPEDAKGQTETADEKYRIYYKLFIDADGGYKDSKGGYYNPKAGTYTDKEGGVVDNWSGYTYKDGSYKSKFGDFYDAKANVFKLTTGETIKVEPGITPAQAIQLLREDVAANGGYDKEFTRRSMMQSIKFDHPIELVNKPPVKK